MKAEQMNQTLKKICKEENIRSFRIMVLTHVSIWIVVVFIWMIIVLLVEARILKSFYLI